MSTNRASRSPSISSTDSKEALAEFDSPSSSEPTSEKTPKPTVLQKEEKPVFSLFSPKAEKSDNSEMNVEKPVVKPRKKDHARAAYVNEQLSTRYQASSHIQAPKFKQLQPPSSFIGSANQTSSASSTSANTCASQDAQSSSHQLLNKKLLKEKHDKWDKKVRKDNGRMEFEIKNAEDFSEFLAWMQTNSLGTDSTLVVKELGVSGVGLEEAQLLAHWIKGNTTLSELSIGGYKKKLGDSGLKVLVDALESNATLKKLHLGDSRIGPEGAGYLARWLKSNTALTTLNLGNSFRKGNHIGPEGARYIAEALKVNKSLRVLILLGNRIGDTGVKSLTQGLKNNATLTWLDVSCNHIGPPGFKSVADWLENNPSIITLKISTNERIDDDEVAYLADALESNATLTSLELGTGHDGKGAKCIAQALKANTTLKEISFYMGYGDKLVDSVLKENHDPYSNANLCRAILSNSIKQVKTILAGNNIDLFEASPWGEIPLELAIQQERAEIVQLLLTHLDVDLKEAYYQLADNYYQGRGVSQVGIQAVHWYRKAAEQGHAMAQSRVVQLLLAPSNNYSSSPASSAPFLALPVRAELVSALIRIVEQGIHFDTLCTSPNQRKLAMIIGQEHLERLTAPTAFIQAHVDQTLSKEQVEELAHLEQKAKEFIAQLPHIPMHGLSTIFAALILASPFSLDALEDLPYLNTGTDIGSLFPGDTNKQYKVRKAAFSLLKNWDGNGLDGAGNGTSGLLELPRGRLPKLTDELLNRLEWF